RWLACLNGHCSPSFLLSAACRFPLGGGLRHGAPLFRRGLVTPTVIDPALFVVLRVVHHPQGVKGAPGLVYAADHAGAVGGHVEHDAVPDLIGRPECLPEFPEMSPRSALGQLVPGGQIPFGDRGIMLPRFPELPQPSSGDDTHASPVGSRSHPTGMIIANRDK